MLLLSPYIANPLPAMIAMGFASFALDLALPGCWSTCMDVGGRYAGTVSGSMNMMGNLGGVFGPIVIGHILLATNRDWHPIFVVSSVIYFLGGICWAFIDPVTPFDKPAKA